MNKEGYYRLVAAIIKKAVEDYHLDIDSNLSEMTREAKLKHKRSADIFFKSKRFERLCDAGGLNANVVRQMAGVVKR